MCIRPPSSAALLQTCWAPHAAGEYIAVEKLENVFKQNSLVEQIWVYGNSFESALVAVVVPKEGPIMEWAAQNGINGSFEVRCFCVSECVSVSVNVCLLDLLMTRSL